MADTLATGRKKTLGPEAEDALPERVSTSTDTRPDRPPRRMTSKTNGESDSLAVSEDFRSLGERDDTLVEHTTDISM